MSLKSLVQIFILLVILIILGGVYYNYFAENKIISLEDNEKSIQSEIDIENNEIKETKTLPEKSSANKEINISEEVKTGEVKTAEVKSESTNQKKIKKNKPKIDNVVKDIEYLTTDKSGNKYKILATSGRTNIDDKNVLDLDNVRGVITSKDKSTVYIVSDFAEYNSSDLQSNHSSIILYVPTIIRHLSDSSRTSCFNLPIYFPTVASSCSSIISCI